METNNKHIKFNKETTTTDDDPDENKYKKKQAEKLST